MHVKDKIWMDREGLIENGPVTIVAFGDSVTHGALRDSYSFETAYWNLLYQKIIALRCYIPVTMINAGIAGISAKQSLDRLDKQVLSHSPDLVIVCFGLNDVNGPLEEYLFALRTIFQRCRESGADVIFMTPNMLNTYVAEDTEKEYLDYAARSAEYQNGGRMDHYIACAIDLAKEMHVSVCDCYAKWKELSKTQDTTMLLADRINHPVPEMHRLFADSLFDTIFN